MKMKKRTLALRCSIFALIFAGTVFGSYVLTPNRTKLVEQDLSDDDEDFVLTPFSKFVSKISGIFSDEDDEDASPLCLSAQIQDLNLSWPSQTLSNSQVSINGSLDLITTGLSDLTFTLEANAKYNDKKVDLGVGYVDETMYLALNEFRIKSKMNDVKEMFNDISTLFFDSENENGLGLSLNIDDLLGSLNFDSLLDVSKLSIVETDANDYNKVEITTLPNAGDLNLDVTLLLNKETDDLMVVNANCVKFRDITIKGTVLCEYNLNQHLYGLDNEQYPVKRGEFIELVNYSSWIDKLFNLLDTRKIGLGLNTTISKISSDGKEFLTNLDLNTNIDFSSLIDFKNINIDDFSSAEKVLSKLYFDATIGLNDVNGDQIINLQAALNNNLGYISLNNDGVNSELRAKISFNEISGLIEKIPQLISSFGSTESVIDLDLDTLFDKITDSELVNAVQSGEYDKILDIVESFVQTKNEISLRVNLSTLGFGNNSIIELRLNTLESIKAPSNIIEVKLENVELAGFSIDATLNTQSYSNHIKENIIADDANNKYLELNFVSDTVDQVINLINNPRAGFNITGFVQSVEETNNSISFDGSGQFDYNLKKGFGNLRIESTNDKGTSIHKIDLNVDNSAPEPENDNVFFAYNTKLKGRVTIKTFTDIFDLVNELISTEDPRFTKFLDPIKATLTASLIGQVIESEDYLMLLNNHIFKEISFNEINQELKIVIAKELLALDSDISVKIGFANIKGKKEIRSLTISLEIAGKEIYAKLMLTDYIESNKPTLDISDPSKFMDFSDIKVLLAFGINTTKLGLYHLTASVDAKVLGIKLTTIPLDFYIEVNGESTKVYGQARIKYLLGQIGRIGHTIVSEFVFEPNLTEDDKIGGKIHLVRSDVSNSSSKISNKYYWVSDGDNFVSNIVDYLCKDFLTLDSLVYKEIKKATVEEQATEDPVYEDMFVEPFVYTHSSNEDKWTTTLSLKALTGNTNLGNAKIDLRGSEVNGENYFTKAILNLTFVSIVEVAATVNLVDINPSILNWNSIAITAPDGTTKLVNDRYNYIINISSNWNSATRDTYFNQPLSNYTSF